MDLIIFSEFNRAAGPTGDDLWTLQDSYGPPPILIEDNREMHTEETKNIVVYREH